MNYGQMGYDDEGQMGSELADSLGINIDLSKLGSVLLTQGAEGAKAYAAGQVVGSKEVQSLAYQASEKSLVDKVSYFIVSNKKIIAVGVLAAGALWAFKKFRK